MPMRYRNVFFSICAYMSVPRCVSVCACSEVRDFIYRSVSAIVMYSVVYIQTKTPQSETYTHTHTPPDTYKHTHTKNTHIQI